MTLEHDLVPWLRKRMPKEWFRAAPEVAADDDEILILGTLADPDLPDGATPATEDAARVAAIQRFREATRNSRVEIASEMERTFGRKVSWGVRCGEIERLFTSLAVPVMTRLRLPERRLLDTLVAGGVARSRSEALAWCVRLVGTHEADWLRNLDDALTAVRKVRTEGPRAV